MIIAARAGKARAGIYLESIGGRWLPINQFVPLDFLNFKFFKDMTRATTHCFPDYRNILCLLLRMGRSH